LRRSYLHIRHTKPLVGDTSDQRTHCPHIDIEFLVLRISHLSVSNTEVLRTQWEQKFCSLHCTFRARQVSHARETGRLFRFWPVEGSGEFPPSLCCRSFALYKIVGRRFVLSLADRAFGFNRRLCLLSPLHPRSSVEAGELASKTQQSILLSVTIWTRI